MATSLIDPATEGVSIDRIAGTGTIVRNTIDCSVYNVDVSATGALAMMPTAGLPMLTQSLRVLP